MKLPLRTLSILILITVLAAACNPSGGTTPTQLPVLTQAEATEQETATTQPTAQPFVTVTQAPPTSTSTAEPTATSTPTTTPSLTPEGTPGSCTDQAKFVEDMTIPDHTQMLPAQDFIKPGACRIQAPAPGPVHTR